MYLEATSQVLTQCHSVIIGCQVSLSGGRASGESWLLCLLLTLLVLRQLML